ncbi:MAG: hypothetical protein ABIR30_03785 [Chitinophagaceae bacterium]
MQNRFWFCRKELLLNKVIELVVLLIAPVSGLSANAGKSKMMVGRYFSLDGDLGFLKRVWINTTVKIVSNRPDLQILRDKKIRLSESPALK